MRQYTNTLYLDETIIHYRTFELAHVEALLETWLSEEWGKSPYRDVLIPTLIGHKLDLNEEEYQIF